MGPGLNGPRDVDAGRRELQREIVVPATAAEDTWLDMRLAPEKDARAPSARPALAVSWEQLIDTARHCPSPHNVQPWRIQVLDDRSANLYVDGTRTFPWTDRTGSFILSAMTMFTTMLEMTARNRGVQLTAEVQDVNKLDLRDPLSLFAKLELEPKEGLAPAAFTDDELLKRKTSRQPNLSRPLPDQVMSDVKELVRSHGYDLTITADQRTINRTINRDIGTLFHDLNHRPYFSELKPYIKLGAKERELDGLHFEAMNLPRIQLGIMKYAPWALTLPGVRDLSAWMYRRQLGHCEGLGFVCGDFWEREASLKAGSMLINTWLTLSRHNLHIHPFGNLVTNLNARRDIEKMLGIEKMWLVFRVGFTNDPVKSNRLPVGNILVDAAERI